MTEYPFDEIVEIELQAVSPAEVAVASEGPSLDRLFARLTAIRGASGEGAASATREESAKEALELARTFVELGLGYEASALEAVNIAVARDPAAPEPRILRAYIKLMPDREGPPEESLDEISEEVGQAVSLAAEDSETLRDAAHLYALCSRAEEALRLERRVMEALARSGAGESELRDEEAFFARIRAHLAEQPGADDAWRSRP